MQLSVGKLELPAPPTFLTHDAAEHDNTLLTKCNSLAKLYLSRALGQRLVQSFSFLFVKVRQLLVLFDALSLSIHQTEVMTGKHVIFVARHLSVDKCLLHVGFDSVLPGDVVVA